MSAKFKSAAVLFITLLLGMLIGFLIKTWIVEDKFERMGRIIRPGGLMHILEETVELTEQQKNDLLPVVEYYHEKIKSIGLVTREKLTGLIDSLKTEIRAILTKEQYEILEDSFMFNPPKELRPFGGKRFMKPDSAMVKEFLDSKPDSISWKEYRKMRIDSFKKSMKKRTNKN